MMTTVYESIQKQLKCPICKKPSERYKTRNPFLPFCSDRCRTIDLGKWLDGKYVITEEEPTYDPDL
ncbi:DNA gyrase inhibitor YacG [Nitrospinae bacterium]|nr:DNA gyrase inhibitor YacG [Nitrospinota bacterium]